MSNPDLPGPYWQDQDDAAYGAARLRTGPDSPSRADSAWDDGGFWRDDRSRGRDDRPAGGADNGRSRSSRSNGRAGDPRGGSPRAARPRDDWDGDRGTERGGRFSQTADDLRSRLGVRGPGGSRGRAGAGGARSNGAHSNGARSSGPRPDEDSWGDEYGANGSGASGTGTIAAAIRSRAARGGASAMRGMRRIAPGAGAAYPLDNDGDYGDYGDDRRYGAGNGTALRSRVAGLPDTRRGGGGGNNGGGGGGGGHRGGGGGRPNGPDPRSRGERFTDWLLYGSWWRHWTLKKVLFLVGGGFAALVLLGIVGIAVGYSMTPIPTDVSQSAQWQSSSVYFKDGHLLGTFTNSQDINRQLLTWAQIPQNVDNAIIAAEDRNFYHEGGISVTGIARAAYNNLFGSGGLQGGSTITEQYAKNYYANIGASRSPTTKVKEIFVAIKLAHSRSKPWILTNYLNTVPFGGNIYGVWAAAEDYFGIDLSKQGASLNTAQAAMLGAMPNEPGVFNPDPAAGSGYAALVQRWQYVLTNMLRDRAITQSEANTLCATCALPQAEQAFNKAIKLHESSGSNGWTGTTGYLMGMVEQELKSTYHLSTTQIETGGLRITTTFSQSMMQALSRAVNTEKKQMANAGVPLPYYDHFGISLEDPTTGGIVAIYGGPGYISNQKRCLRLYCQYNMAEAPHPVGSSMKPYVLATAINQGMNVQTSKLNGYSPLWIPPDWTPQDQNMLSTPQPPAMGAAAAKSAGWWESQGEASLGPISVSVAAAQSSDPAFTDLAHKVGVENIIKTAQLFGVGDDPFNAAGGNDLQGLTALFGPKGSIAGSVQIALGQGDLTPIEQASTFATLMNKGVYRAPHVISKLSAWKNGGEQPVQVHVPTHMVMTPQAAADEDYALSFDNVNGTGYPNATWPGRSVIGKTGTLGNGNLASEAWFVGAIPQYAMAVGLWTNSQTQNLDNLPSLGGIGGSFGGAWPAAAWKAFMETQFANLPVASLPTPDYTGFATWIQVAPKKQRPACQQGQFKNCRCPKGQNCQVPNPGSSCGQKGNHGQPCGGTSPSPSPSCGFLGQNCNSPSPAPSPTTGAAVTTASVGGAGGSSGAVSTALTAVLWPADEARALLAVPLRLLL